MAEKTPDKAPGTFSLLGTASTMGLHMVSGPIVGGCLGWLIDQGLDSWPVASAVGLVLGLAAGFRNVWADARYLERSNAAIDAEKKEREEKKLTSAQSLERIPAKEAGKPSAAAIVPEAVVEAEVSKISEISQLPPASEGYGENSGDTFTASILAGTASPEERELEELDETVEAIRRALEGSSLQSEKGRE